MNAIRALAWHAAVATGVAEERLARIRHWLLKRAIAEDS